MRTSLKNDQRGIGYVIIIVAIVVIAAIGAVGWKLTQKDDVVKNASPATKATITACQKIYDDKDLCNFAGAYDIEKLSYKMVMTSTSTEGNSKMTILSDGKGNTSTTSEAAGQEFALIELRGVTYMKGAGETTWTKYPKNDTSVPKETDPISDVKFNAATIEAESKTISYKKIGKEKCGSLNCLKYQVTDKSTPGTTNFFWFDTKDYRMQRYTTKDAKTKTSSDMVITYQSVTIKEPSPVKELTAADSGIDTQALQQQIQDSMNAATTE